jgi:5-(carboxyamino)imidazole ribonucleotide synthase
MSEPLAPGATIGIIGGGQLGRMLAMAAARLGYRTVVLEPQADCPAAQLSNHQIVSAYDDPAALDALARQASVVTYEFENVPVEAANRLALSVPVFPPPRALEVSQDRLAEKTFLNANGISTAAFRAVDNDGDIAAALDAFDGSGVLKTRRLGYDGKGQRVLRSGEVRSLEGTFVAMGNVPLIIEELVSFECEISMIAARAATARSQHSIPLAMSTVKAYCAARPCRQVFRRRSRGRRGGRASGCSKRSTMWASSASNSS